MTPRDMTFKLKHAIEGSCPLCDCNLSTGSTYYDGGFATQELRCENEQCGAAFSAGWRAVDLYLVGEGENAITGLTEIIDDMEKEAKDENNILNESGN